MNFGDKCYIWKRGFLQKIANGLCRHISVLFFYCLFVGSTFNLLYMRYHSKRTEPQPSVPNANSKLAEAEPAVIVHSAKSKRRMNIVVFVHSGNHGLKWWLIIFCTGVAWGCRWTWDYTGIFRETCYCEDRDGCNGAGHLSVSLLSAVLAALAVLYNMVHWLWFMQQQWNYGLFVLFGYSCYISYWYLIQGGNIYKLQDKLPRKCRKKCAFWVTVWNFVTNIYIVLLTLVAWRQIFIRDGDIKEKIYWPDVLNHIYKLLLLHTCVARKVNIDAVKFCLQIIGQNWNCLF